MFVDQKTFNPNCVQKALRDESFGQVTKALQDNQFVKLRDIEARLRILQITFRSQIPSKKFLLQ